MRCCTVPYQIIMVSIEIEYIPVSFDRLDHRAKQMKDAEEALPSSRTTSSFAADLTRTVALTAAAVAKMSHTPKLSPRPAVWLHRLPPTRPAIHVDVAVKGYRTAPQLPCPRPPATRPGECRQEASASPKPTIEQSPRQQRAQRKSTPNCSTIAAAGPSEMPSLCSTATQTTQLPQSVAQELTDGLMDMSGRSAELQSRLLADRQVVQHLLRERKHRPTRTGLGLNPGGARLTSWDSLSRGGPADGKCDLEATEGPPPPHPVSVPYMLSACILLTLATLH